METNQTEKPSEEKEEAAKVKKAATEKTPEKTEKAEKAAPSKTTRTKPAEKKSEKPKAKPVKEEAEKKPAPEKEEEKATEQAEAALNAEPQAEGEAGKDESLEIVPEGETKRPHFSSRMLNRGTPEELAKKKRKKLMKKFRRAKKIPNSSDVERFTPSVDEGLSPEQVETRFNQFLFNDVNKKYSKSYKSIFFGNICTVFNLLCVLVAAALIVAQAPITQFLFVGIFGVNLVIGIVQEILAKKQTDKLSVLISSTAKVVRNGATVEIPIQDIVVDDVIILEAGQQVPADCIMEEGNAEVNESLLTGESVAIKKTHGDILYAGSFIASGTCKVRADKVGKATYLNNLTSKAKKYKKPKSEILNSIRLFIRVIGVLIPFVAAAMFWRNWEQTGHDMSLSIQYTGSIVIGMIPSGLLLLTSLAMAIGVRRLAKKQTLVQDLYSLEMLARVNTLCLDKTGTITDGRMTVNDCMVLSSFVDYTIDEIMGCMLASLEDNNQTSIALFNRFGHSNVMQPSATLPFSSKRKLSAVSFQGVGTFVMGAPEFVLRPMPPKIDKIVKQYAQSGLRVLVVAFSPNQMSGGRVPSLLRPTAIITLMDNIREDAVETIKWFRENDVDIKIISGDNPVTVSEVARRVGVKHAGQYISLDGLTDIEVENVANQYTVFGRVTPEQKAILVRTIKKQGNTVAMTGDGVNDILALKEADCAISVASGSEAARNVSHIVLMDNNFLNLPNVVYEGRRVINNIKNSASLYLMKTLFITILAIICFAMSHKYFFTTDNMLLFEMLVAALPSFVISLQPNKNRVKGKFLLYILSRSIPSALTLLFCVIAVFLGIRFAPGEQLGGLDVVYDNGVLNMTPTADALKAAQDLARVPESGVDVLTNPLLLLAVTLGGMVTLFRILQPMNLLRSVTFLVAFGGVLVMLCVPILGTIVYKGWLDVHFNFTQILFIVCTILAAFPISSSLIKVFDLMNSKD
ncbi:MAG: HAD-IC family P-type ATPase [Clostridia bacterium]|nr:HAD-IC family P-type ATPase [Clostridia bacterium]